MENGSQETASSQETSDQTVTRSTGVQQRRQGRYWMLTIPRNSWLCPVSLPNGLSYLKGQLERGDVSDYEHWQLLAVFKKKSSLRVVKSLFGNECHAELSRSSAANQYVWKEATRIDGTQLELGTLPYKRNDPEDWERIWTHALEGEILAIPAQIRVQHYRTLRAVSADFAEPLFVERSCVVFWGPTGTGKSRRAWDEAGTGAYPKDPRSKFWCGYKGQKDVVIDEFRGDIDISHLLRWLDRYPVIVEIKGASTVLSATRIWITSNLSPKDWYPALDDATFAALERRLKVYNMSHNAFFE